MKGLWCEMALHYYFHTCQLTIPLAKRAGLGLKNYA